MTAPAPEREQPFGGLAPEIVLDAASSAGFDPDGRLAAMNSYENRVYQLGETTHGRLVLKFYRAGRWSDAQIEEEHAFTAELAAAELPVAAPLPVENRTLLEYRGFRFAIFPWMRGRSPELDAPDARAMLGRALGRIHRIGAVRPFRHRPEISVERLGRGAREDVLASGLLPVELESRYAETADRLIERIESVCESVSPLRSLRIHGDCHLGNLLWNERGPVFVDLDDCVMGPAVQDLWMLVSGPPAVQQREWAALIEGYEQFADFDYREVRLIEPLRALRMLHHAGWVAHRWRDPAFPLAFPWFGETRHWESYITDLREQTITIDAQPLLT